jgi:hypothetical protein
MRQMGLARRIKALRRKTTKMHRMDCSAILVGEGRKFNGLAIRIKFIFGPQFSGFSTALMLFESNGQA